MPRALLERDHPSSIQAFLLVDPSAEGGVLSEDDVRGEHHESAVLGLELRRALPGAAAGLRTHTRIHGGCYRGAEGTREKMSSAAGQSKPRAEARARA